MHGNTNLKRFFAWLPATMIAAAIFYFSAQTADQSTEMSDGVTTILLKIAETLGLLELSPELVYDLCGKLSTPVRKLAHITEYMILHASILFGLYHWSEDMRGKKWLKWAFVMTVFYAATDEFHQLFVPGRAGMVQDVVIDSLGAAVVTFVLWKWKLKRG